MAPVTALVCTVDRPALAKSAVQALLRSEGVELELILMDQSAGDETSRALGPLLADPRLVYVRTVARGKPHALNEGLARARGEVVVCTDDDCQPSRSWVARMAEALLSQPGAALAFCRVDPAPHDASAGYVPSFAPRSTRLVRTLTELMRERGIGAGMALQRAAVLALGGFDEAVGPGALFPSGDDYDLAVRALLHGYGVFQTSDVSITHHGFRTFAEGRLHARLNFIGIGAICAKALRVGGWSSLPLTLWEFGAHALWPPFGDLVRFRRPRGLSRIVGFAQGFVRGLQTRLDRERIRFVPGAACLQLSDAHGRSQ
ncbi:MAG TPA: glycosyltransferase [Myxococcales bacterium]|nr:glycosyltransferase [Myxococcales bacterium]